MEELCFELPQLQSSDQDNTGETSKMPMATDIDRDGFSRKQNCLHQTQDLLGGGVSKHFIRSTEFDENLSQ